MTILAKNDVSVIEWSSLGGIEGRYVRRSGADVFTRAGGHLLANLARRRHRLDGRAHDLRGSRPARFVGRLGFEELGVREDDPELIAQTVQQIAKFGRIGHRRL